jgi:alcohol dehydrogenase (cytochrome c)
MYVLDRATGEFLSGKPFVEVNWMSGFDERGRPKLVPPNADTGRRIVLPGSGTNWQPHSYSPKTGLFYIPAWDGGNNGIVETARRNYGAVRAFDPHTGEKKWEFRGTDAIFSSGVLTTASGLLFSGAADGYFYALDAVTGELLWRMSLAGSVTSGPMTYSVAGKQYVTVAAGNVLFTFAVR